MIRELHIPGPPGHELLIAMIAMQSLSDGFSGRSSQGQRDFSTAGRLVHTERLTRYYFHIVICTKEDVTSGAEKERVQGCEVQPPDTRRQTKVLTSPSKKSAELNPKPKSVRRYARTNNGAKDESALLLNQTCNHSLQTSYYLSILGLFTFILLHIMLLS